MKLFKNFLLIIFSTFFGILILELFLLFFMPQERNGSWRIQDKSGTYFNIKNQSARHEFFGKYETISINYNFGEFHNRIYKNLLINQNNPKILIVGDSNIFGWLLPDNNTFIYKLQEKFVNYNFINASAGGWSDIDSLNYIKKFCNITYY